ncbi:MAG: IS3 family transposase [Phormidesmis sp.]
MDEVDPGWREQFARVLQVCRTQCYRMPTKQHKKDEADVALLREAHAEHPFYGVERLAIHLSWSEVKTRRIRNLASITIACPNSKKRRSSSALAEIAAAPNALKCFAVFRDETRPQAGQSYRNMTNAGAWVQDFTHLRFGGEERYLAVVLDLKTRQVVGWRLGTRHSSELTLAAMLDALSKHPAPAILHSDQGSEYLSYKHQELCQRMEITLSCSKRASPWQNGFMERWFGNFKLELGNIGRHKDIAQLHEAIALAIFYYNTKRIHSALKMSPAAYAARLKEQPNHQNRRLKSLDRVLREVRG